MNILRSCASGTKNVMSIWFMQMLFATSCTMMFVCQRSQEKLLWLIVHLFLLVWCATRPVKSGWSLFSIIKRVCIIFLPLVPSPFSRSVCVRTSALDGEYYTNCPSLHEKHPAYICDFIGTISKWEFDTNREAFAFVCTFTKITCKWNWNDDDDDDFAQVLNVNFKCWLCVAVPKVRYNKVDQTY